MEAIMERIAVALERIADALKHPDDDEDVSVVNRLLAIQSDLESEDGDGIGITISTTNAILDDGSTADGLVQAVQQIADRVRS